MNLQKTLKCHSGIQKKTIFVSLLCTLFIFAETSCNKDSNITLNNSSNSSQPCKSTGNNSTMEIAYYTQNGVEASFMFNLDSFEIQFRPKIQNNIGDDYIYEDIAIFDDYPYNLNNPAYLKIAVFKISEGASLNIFYDIDKINTNDTIKYFTALPGQEGCPWTFVTCKGSNCYANQDHTESGCKRDGKNCTPCVNSDGTCERTETPVMQAIGTAIGTIASAIIAAIASSTKK